MDTTLILMLDSAFKALIREWQEDVLTQESGATLASLARVLNSWLGESVSTRDRTHLSIVKLVPERISMRIGQIARDTGVSQPHMMLAMLAAIEQILRDTGTPEGTRAAQLWAQHLAAQWPPHLWMGDFDHNEPRRSIQFP